MHTSLHIIQHYAAYVLQNNESGASKVKQGVQNIKEKLSGHTMGASGPIAAATGSSGGAASSTGHP